MYLVKTAVCLIVQTVIISFGPSRFGSSIVVFVAFGVPTHRTGFGAMCRTKKSYRKTSRTGVRYVHRTNKLVTILLIARDVSLNILAVYFKCLHWKL